MLKLRINNVNEMNRINRDGINGDSINIKGFSALGMTLIILLLGVLLLSSLSNTSLSWRMNFINSKRYYRNFNYALSSIEWGVSQTWQEPTQNWQCQSLASYQLTACIKQSTLSTGNYVIIRGQSDQFKLYHLTTFEHGKLNIQRGHWLDYCPENRSLACD